MPEHGRLLPRSFLARDVLIVAPDLIGRVLVDTDSGVAVRLTEVEAYAGPLDPASHAFRRTARSEVMYGPPGRLYVYFIYGMHWCANVVTGPEGTASAILLRAGEVVGGLDVAGQRRPRARRPADLARGPAGLATVLGLSGAATGSDLLVPGRRWEMRLGARPPAAVEAGPRVGVSAAADLPWRFYERDHDSVSVYRRGTRATHRNRA